MTLRFILKLYIKRNVKCYTFFGVDQVDKCVSNKLVEKHVFNQARLLIHACTVHIHVHVHVRVSYIANVLRIHRTVHVQLNVRVNCTISTVLEKINKFLH